MDLTNKNQVDFKDAHLWAADAKLFCAVAISKVHLFLPCAAGMKLIVHPFMDFDPNPDISRWTVTIEAQPIVEIPPWTCEEINKFIKIAYAAGTKPTIEHDGHVALLALDGTIIERWEAEHRR